LIKFDVQINATRFHNKKWRKRKMRDLHIDELELVSGGGGCAPSPNNCSVKHENAKPCGPQGNNGFGNGGHDGVPGHSNFQDDTR
jgi:hypothetical protein